MRTFTSHAKVMWRKYCTGNFDKQQLRAMALRMFTVRKVKIPGETNLDFRSVEVALFLKSFPKVKNEHANQTEVVERGGEASRNAVELSVREPHNG